MLPLTNADTPPEAIGLKVYSDQDKFGVHCPAWVDRSSMLVLASDRDNYTSDEVNRITGYGQGAGSVPLPTDLLRQVAGVLTASSAPLTPGTTGDDFAPTCAFRLQLTNTGSTAMQITKAGFRLTGQPEVNDATYRLVEMCSVGFTPCPPGLGAGPAPCGNWVVSLEARAAAPGTNVEDAPQQIVTPGFPQQCPGLTINPGETNQLRIDIWSSRNMVYPIEPVLNVSTASGDKLVPIVDQAGSAAFGNAGQFSCLKLQGKAFTVYEQGASVFHPATQANAPAWCL